LTPTRARTSATLRLSLVTFATVVLLGGCARFDSRRGVEVAWSDSAVAGLQRGESTRAEVLDLLGPPSQVIALEDETALYYLLERERGRALLLLVFNRLELQANYDRAIFFFDANDVLTDFSVRVGEGEGDA